MEQMSKERIERIKGWKINPSFKPDTQAARILKYLKENGETQYKDLKENESWNYSKNLRHLRSMERMIQEGIEEKQKQIDKIKSEGLKDLRLYRWNKDPESLFWGTYKEDSDPRIEWLTVEEHIQHYQKEIDRSSRDLKKYKDKIEEVTKTPGKYFKLISGQEPYYSQLVASLVVDGYIEKTKRGFYKITNKGLTKV